MTDEQLELLITKLVEREVDEAERLTIAVATGTGIAWGGQDAYEAWQSARGRATMPGPAGDPVVARNVQIAQLAQMFPKSVKVD